MLSVIVIAILLNSVSAKAAIEPNYYVKKPEQVPFFKSATSLFPSGSTTLEKLKKHLVRSESSVNKYYKWNKIYFDEDELRPLFATHLSKYVIDDITNQRLKVISASTKTILVFNEKYGSSEKVPVSSVHGDAYDIGLAMALKDTYIKTRADDRAPILTTIPLGTAFDVEKFQGAFALIRYQNYRGYVSLSEIISKFDFASFVFANGEWQPVKTREFDQIITSSNKKIPMNSITGLITPPQVGIIASNTQKIPLWSRVQTTKTNVASWQLSKLKEHGLVWWKPNKEYEQVYYSLDEILKKEISFVSFHPFNPYKGIVSADGVYITQNGTHWKKLPQFESYNGPVFYLNDQLLFVGNFRSTDGGQTFENYIQIDKLASAIEFQYGFTPKKLQVKKIDSPTPMKIKIEIDTGIRKIKMESPIFSQNWQAAKT